MDIIITLKVGTNVNMKSEKTNPNLACKHYDGGAITVHYALNDEYMRSKLYLTFLNKSITKIICNTNFEYRLIHCRNFRFTVKGFGTSGFVSTA